MDTMWNRGLLFAARKGVVRKLARARAETESRLSRPPETGQADDLHQQVVKDSEGAPSLREWEFWKRVIAVLTLVGVGATVFLGLRGLFEANRLQRASMDSHLGEVMMGFDRHFVVYPRLRRYFYANSEISQTLPPRATRLRTQTLSTAEMLIDFADDVAAYVGERKMSKEEKRHWASIVGPYFCESPITRYAWKRYHDAYGKDTASILGAPYGTRAVQKWDWRANKPKATSARCGYLRADRPGVRPLPVRRRKTGAEPA
jgi:hypothetical protein